MDCKCEQCRKRTDADVYLIFLNHQNKEICRASVPCHEKIHLTREILMGTCFGKKPFQMLLKKGDRI